MNAKDEMTADEYITAAQELERHSDQVVHFLIGFTASSIPPTKRARAIAQAREIYGPRDGS